MKTLQNHIKKLFSYRQMLWALIFISICQVLEAGNLLILHDKDKGIVSIHSGDDRLILRLNYNYGCYFDRVEVRGNQVIDPQKGVFSAIKINGQLFSTRDKIQRPRVTVNGDTVMVENIRYGSKDYYVEESWQLSALQDAIQWRIRRCTEGDGFLEDAASAEWVFSDMQSWTGAILDNGGVAWNRLLESKNMTYGSHAGKVLFWNRTNDHCLEIDPTDIGDQHIATRFTHNSDDTQSFVHTLSDSFLETRINLSRFLTDSQVLWKPFRINNDTKVMTYRISAPSYKSRYNLGDFHGVDEDAVREILNTITRYGVIDNKLCGANGWRTGYICLHEQWFAQMAMAIQDDGYTYNLSEAYNHYRDHAVLPDGRVLARFKDNNDDAMSGTYTEQGFYEAKWGYLLDSQPDYVMVVAEQFHNTGDLTWVRGQKKTCEAVLEYLLQRDADGDGLLEMMNQSHKDKQGSDWLDIIWAAHENALVNAEMYGAMILWAEVEDILEDQQMAKRYRKAAVKLKDSFNKDIKDGGFWNPEKKWYVYWRDKDGSVHGNNLVIPVNFSAIGYALCDDETRRAALLDVLEEAMQKENLFSWPLCIYSFEREEVRVPHNYPFPKYENGDIFLSWVELGTRSYAKYNPDIAMKYIGKIIEQYNKDGLAYQRYARVSQNGLGSDILAGNGMAVVGLYRNIFGIQPQYNRLYLEPHLTEALNNTLVKYQLRGIDYRIILRTDQYQISANNFTISASRAFAMNTNNKRLEYYEGKNRSPRLSFERAGKSNLHVSILNESKDRLPVWTVQCDSPFILTQKVHGLKPGVKYCLYMGSEVFDEKVADPTGCVPFSLSLTTGEEKHFTLDADDVDERIMDLINKAGNADDDETRLKLLLELSELPDTDQNLHTDVKRLITEIKQWLYDKSLTYFERSIFKTNNYDFGIQKTSLLYPITKIYRARMIFWVTLEHGRFWSFPEIRRERLDLVHRLMEEVRESFPENRLIRMYLGEPVPPSKSYESSAGAPEWAVYQREGIERLADIIEWWIDHRQQENGAYGGGWDDDCEMWRWWVPVLIAFDDPKISKAQSALSHGLLNLEKMQSGYTDHISDVEHTAEPSADALTPMMHLEPENEVWNRKALRLGELMESFWSGINERGYLQFKSTYFSVDSISPDRKKACDTVYHPRIVQPTLLYWQRTGDVHLKKLFSSWMDTWVEASVRADRGKPAGIIPSAIHWPDGEIGGLGKNWWNPENHSPKSKLYVWPSAMSLMLNTLLLTNYMTDDPKYLEPIWSMAKIRLAYLKNTPNQPPVPGSEAWCGSKLGGLSSIVAKYMLLSKNTKFDQLLKTDKNPYVAFRFNGDRELLVTALHNNAKALRINFAGYTSEVRYTDRVLRFPAVFRDNGIYPPGIPTIHQPNIYLLYATLTGDPGDALYFPINAVRWITPPRDIAALVTETGKDRFAAELFHFGEKPREMSAVFYLLDSGEYNFKIFTLGKNTKVLTDKRMLISDTKIPISFKLPVKTPCKLEISPTS